MEVKDIDVLAKELAEARIIKDAISDQLKEANAKYEEIEKRFVEAMISEGKDSWKVEDIGSLSIKVSTYWNIQDQPKLVDYLLANDRSMVKIHPQSIRGWANELSELGKRDELLQLGLEPYDKVGVTLRRK